jgi:hypothetical protein
MPGKTGWSLQVVQEMGIKEVMVYRENVARGN